MSQVRVPQYLHMPGQLLWFDTEELMVLVVAYTMANTLGSKWAWLVGFALAGLFIWVKRRKPRGFIRHALYQAAIYKLEHYPPAPVRRFYE